MAELCSQKAVLPPSLWGGTPTIFFKLGSNGEKHLLGEGLNLIPESGLKTAFVDFAVECAKTRTVTVKSRVFNRFEAPVNSCMDMLRVNLSIAS
jgi:hypothetical protein